MSDQPAPPPANPNPAPQGDTGIAALTHASGILTGFIVPLVIYLIKDDDPFVKEHARNALNFQISYAIYMLVASVLVVVLVGIFLLIVLVPAWFILCIVAAIKANNGEMYSYPATINLVK